MEKNDFNILTNYTLKSNSTCINIKQPRNEWLDVAKGITIILMVFGHTGFSTYWVWFIYAFHMPLFFIASGWTSNWTKYNIHKFIFHKVRTLLFPFIIYSCIVLIINDLTVKSGGFHNFIKKGWGEYALWFVQVLFLASFLVKIIHYIKSNILRYIVIMMLGVLGSLLSLNDILLPWSLSSVPYASVLIYIGSEIRRIQPYIESKISVLIMLIGFVITFIGFQFCHLNIALNHVTPMVQLTIIAVSGTLMVFALSYLLVKYFPLIKKILIPIGKATYIVVAFSQVGIQLLNYYFSLNPIIKYLLLTLLLVAIWFVQEMHKKTLKYWIPRFYRL